MSYFLVTMYRFGDLDGHNYLAGCFTKESRAIEIGKMEKEYRGGKYEPVISEIDKLPEGVVKNQVDMELYEFLKSNRKGI